MASQTTPVQPAEDPYAKLTQMKKLLDDGVITQADFDAAKAKLLGLLKGKILIYRMQILMR